MHTVAIISRKGGTGKTTIACSLAVAAQSNGLATAILDMDPQGSATAWWRVRGEMPPSVAPTRQSSLRGHLEAAKEAGVQVVFLDTAPHVAGTASAAAAAADFVLVPCRPGLLDLAAITGSVAIAQERNKPYAIVLNAAPIRSPLIAQAHEALVDTGIVVAPVVHQRVGHAYAVAEGLAAMEREPVSKAAQEIEALWQWLRRELKRKRRKK